MSANTKSSIDKEIDSLFGLLPTGYGLCENPVTGGSFVRGERGMEPIAYQKNEARKVLVAREYLAANGPPDAPPFPLSGHDIEDYRHARGLKGVIGFFARSLAIRDYDVEKHPSFDDFACGLMACNTGVWGFDADEELKRRFPPRPLPGMTRDFYWAPPEEYEESMASYRRWLRAA